FGVIESGFWAWDFLVEGEKGESLAYVNRNFAGFAREIFTDTGVYAVHVDNIEPKARSLSLDERAVILAISSSSSSTIKDYLDLSSSPPLSAPASNRRRVIAITDDEDEQNTPDADVVEGVEEELDAILVPGQPATLLVMFLSF
ncbi:hypothetical protein BC830DRAFT_1173805, partial [Chytriomyces sp. MP71]